jgi:hypothetical protein
LEYRFASSGPIGNSHVLLKANQYTGGRLDWHSFNVASNVQLPDLPNEQKSSRIDRIAIPTPLRFKGMPNARWWEFEDAVVDFGNIPAGPTDLGRMLLIEYMLIYGNDYFVVPIDLPIGAICLTESVIVTDTFGARILIKPANDRQDSDSRWTMFTLSPDDAKSASPMVRGRNLFFLPPVLGRVLSGDHIEDILCVRDEMANLAWAIERVVEDETGNGQDQFERTREKRTDADTLDNKTINSEKPLKYRLATDVPLNWFPLVPVKENNEIWLKLGRMASTNVSPHGDILSSIDRVFEEEIPREGIQIYRNYTYARWTDASTYVWLGRTKRIGKGEGSSGLRYDLAVP